MKKFKKWLLEKELSQNTIKTYLLNINLILKKINKINSNNIKKYFKEIKAMYEPTTIHLKFESLRSYLEFLKNNTLNNIKIKLPTVHQKYFETISIIELKQLSKITISKDNFINYRNELLINLMFYSGLRLSEVANLKWNDLKDQSIKIIGKGNKIRYIVIKDEIFKDLYTLPKTNTYIFTKSNGEKLSSKRIGDIIHQIVIKSTIKKKITPHSFRRSFATIMINNGINITIVQKLLGHSKIETTARYVHQSIENIKNEYNRVFK